MEVSTEKIRLKTDNNKYNNNISNDILTYNQKIQNEINSISKKYKTLFENALNKYNFNSEVYIPHSTEAKRKVIPNKNYLLNKLILYENFVNSNKNKRDNMSKESDKFYNFYSYVKNRNSNQKEYLDNLIFFYRGLGYDIKDINYNKNDNIFNKSILLDPTFGNDTNDDVLKFGNNDQSRRNFYKDNILLLRFNDTLRETKFPYSIAKNDKNQIKNFKAKMTNSINSFIKESQINNKIKNIEEKKNVKKKKNKNENNKNLKTKSNLESQPNFEINELIDKNINDNEKELFEKMGNKSIKFNKEKLNNKKMDTKDNKSFMFNYMTIRSNKFNRNTRKDEDNKDINNYSNKTSRLNTLTTDYGNNSIFNEIKSNKLPENYTTNNLTLKNNISSENYINKKLYQSTNNNGNKTYRNRNSKKAKDKFYISGYNSNIGNNQYLLTTLNKLKVSKTEGNISNNNKSDKKIEFTIKNRNMNREKTQNLKIFLPNISSLKSSQNLSKINILTKEEINSNNINKNRSQKALKNLKITFSKKNTNEAFEKNKKKEINYLYTLINNKRNFYKEYPYDKVKNYFKTFRNIKLANFNIKNGSNIHSLLENLEKIVKDKQYHKLAKSLSEAKRDIHVKVSDNSEKINKIENVEFNKLKEYDMKIPNLKYDFAEKILINNQKMINHDNFDE